MATLHSTKTVLALMPRYVTRFGCIGSACEDNCCSGWTVALDKKTFKAYRNSSHPALKPVFMKHVKRTPETNTDLGYGKIGLDPQTLSCTAMAGGLCSVQKHLDETHLSDTCFSYPRQMLTFAGRLEQALTLSCPEAARQALLHEDAFDFIEQQIAVRPNAPDTGYAAFGLDDGTINDVRIFCLQLMRTRDLALWERLAVLGVFCESLTAALAKGEHGAVPALLREFGAVLEQGKLVEALRALQPNHGAQAMVFSALLSERGFAAATPMQAQFVHEIAQNLGADAHGRVTAEALVSAYRRGLGRLEQALEHAPYLLEHYVLNEMFLNLFPFHGNDPFDAYMQLVARFGLLRLLLAARCNNDDALPDVNTLVNTVHLYCRRFQHNLTFGPRVNDALRASGWSSLDKLYGFLRS